MCSNDTLGNTSFNWTSFMLIKVFSVLSMLKRGRGATGFLFSS